MALTKVTTGGIKDGTITNEDISTTTSISQDKLAAMAAASSTASGLMISADKNKLDGVADNANNYSHPSAHTVSEVTGLQGLLDSKTTETYVNTQITNVVGVAPAALDTLTELAAALGDDANFAGTVTNALAGKVDDSQVLTNVPAGALFTDTNTIYTHPTNHAISEVSGLQTALDGKVDDSQVLTNVPAGALFTDTNTTYSVGDGGLSQVNFTTADNTKLDGIEAGATADQTKADIEGLGLSYLHSGNIGSTDLNNLTTVGVYGNANTSANQPIDNNAGSIIHLKGLDGNYKSQLFQYSSGGDLYVRGKHGSAAAWSSWSKVWHDGNTAGKVLQVVSVTKTDTFSSSSTLIGITGLSATITPTSTSSKILISYYIAYDSTRSNAGGGFRIYKNGSHLTASSGDVAGNRYTVNSGYAANANADQSMLHNSGSYLDTPSSTSALTYQMYQTQDNTSYFTCINKARADPNQGDDGRAASTITLMEIGA